jgi:5'-phosphate synthase pdxT subunit
MTTIGILALQGDFAAHAKSVQRVGARAADIRTSKDLAAIDGLIIPGGESTVMLKLLHQDAMMAALKDFAAQKPVFGTCAGAILLATKVLNPEQESLGVLDIDVERNAYGRQGASHIAVIEPSQEFQKRVGAGAVEAVFIRAPIIRRVGAAANVLMSHNGDPILIEQDRHMAATFHPELTDDTRVHKLFLGKVGRHTN